MIVFDLECINGHAFEGWFQDKQEMKPSGQGLLQCPVCDTTAVVQKLHPIAIRTSAPVRARSNEAAPGIPGRPEAIWPNSRTGWPGLWENNFEDVSILCQKEANAYGASEHRSIGDHHA